jgi:AraC-like DNA-binding protein
MSKQPSTLATFLLPIAKALRLQGLDPMELLEQAEIDPAHVINDDRRVPVANMQRLWQLATAATGDEAFGLSAAEQIQPGTLQGLGFAVLASDTIYQGLQRLVRFSRVLSTGLNISLEERGDFVDMVYAFNADDFAEEFSWQGFDFGMGMVLVMCRLTLGEYLSPFMIEASRPTPADSDRFESLLGSRIKFEAQRNCITFVRADIVDRLITANPELAQVNDEQVENYLASFLDVSTSRDVVGKIVERLQEGPPNQKQIADALHVSNRTLQRKLKDEGTSFVDLLQDTRFRLAQKYLAQPQRSIVEVAYLLGFSEPSTFSRAFKRWTGQAPMDYRQSIDLDSGNHA